MGTASGVLGNATKTRVHPAMAPTAVRKSLGATIDAILTLDELIKRFGNYFVCIDWARTGRED
jgi:hypothetical protein